MNQSINRKEQRSSHTHVRIYNYLPKKKLQIHKNVMLVIKLLLEQFISILVFITIPKKMHARLDVILHNNF